MNTVIILEEAAEAIESAKNFYDAQDREIGGYFAEPITADICNFAISAGSTRSTLDFFEC